MKEAIDQQRDHFNKVANLYHEARKHPNHLRFKEHLWKYAFAEAKLNFDETPVQVLEPMCGYAEGLSVLTSYLDVPFQYSGSDYSDVVIDYLMEKHPDLDVSVEDVTNFKSDKQFDLIILIGGLHHVPYHAEDVVKRLSKSLRPNGYFVNFEPTSGNWLFTKIRDYIYKRNSLFDEETERAFDVKELSGMFEQAGLVNKMACYPGLLAYVLYYNPDAFSKLNIGGPTMVDVIFKLEKIFYKSFFARAFSFATMSIWSKD